MKKRFKEEHESLWKDGEGKIEEMREEISKLRKKGKVLFMLAIYSACQRFRVMLFAGASRKIAVC